MSQMWSWQACNYMTWVAEVGGSQSETSPRQKHEALPEK
jgi:hypothetical protein